MIVQIYDGQEKTEIARLILEGLPEWFGIPESREQYIADSESQVMVAAIEDEKPIGFLCLKETGKDTVEIAVMGVLTNHHRQGIGRNLFTTAKDIAIGKGYSFLQVKTVQMGRYKNYDKTNRFYLRLGFKEFELLPKLWDEWNPCQIYIMSLK